MTGVLLVGATSTVPSTTARSQLPATAQSSENVAPVAVTTPAGVVTRTVGAPDSDVPACQMPPPLRVTAT